MALQIYVDGQLVDEQNATVSVFDHGLLYGDGVFEGIRFYNDRVFRCEEHIRRLYDSASAIALEIPMEPVELTGAMLKTIRANGLHDGYVRLVVTRGAGGLGLNPRLCPKASIIIIASTIKLYPQEDYDNGLKLVTCSTRRPTPASLSPEVKSLNYINNVMAKLEALNAGAVEGVMLNEQGFVAECTGDNVFAVRDGAVKTPPVSAGALNGITRRVIFDIASELKIPLEEANMTRYELYTADEVFLTGTAAEVIPVSEYDGRVVGKNGKPGPVTLRCIEKFRELAKNTGTPIYK